MVKFLIQLLGERFARRIESGSRVGATAGAFMGIAIGVAAVLAMNAAELLDTYRYAMFPIVCIPLGIAGAILGGRFGPANSVASGRNGLRLTNYNHAAAPLVVAAAMAVIALGAIFLPDKETKSAKKPEARGARDTALIYGVFPLVVLGAFVWAWRIVWSVELGPVIVVGRLLRSDQYNRRALEQWAFALDGANRGQEPFEGTGELHLNFNDGKHVVIPLDGRLSAAVVRAIAT